MHLQSTIKSQLKISLLETPIHTSIMLLMNFATYAQLLKHINTIMLKLRGTHQYSQDYVADVLNINQNTYSKLENGQTNPTVLRLYQLSTVYKKDLNIFFSSPIELTLPKTIPNTLPPQIQSPNTSLNSLQNLSNSPSPIINHNDGLSSRGISNFTNYYENHSTVFSALSGIQLEKINLRGKAAYSEQLKKLIEDIAEVLEDFKNEDQNKTVRQFWTEIALLYALLDRVTALAASLNQYQ